MKASEIASKLTKAQREAVIYCERDGNGKHIWSIYPLVRQGLMSLVPVAALQNVPAYRLNEAGLAVRAILQEQQDAR